MTFSGAAISADGADGGEYGFYAYTSTYSYTTCYSTSSYAVYYVAAGGGGSGGSVLIDAPSMRGDATVSADGGAPAGLSTTSSGGGGGGRVGIHVSSTKVPAEIIFSALGGTNSSSTCGGGAGTIFVNSGTQQTLLVDNADANVDSSTYTPLPADEGLGGVDLFVVRNSHVQVTTYRARRLRLDSSSSISGDELTVTAHNASIEGAVTSTSLARMMFATNLDVASTASLECASIFITVPIASIDGDVSSTSLARLNVAKHLDIASSASLECAGCLINISTPVLRHAGQLESGSLDVLTRTASIEGGVTCTSLARVNALTELNISSGASVECTGCAIEINTPALLHAGQLGFGGLNVTSNRARIEGNATWVERNLPQPQAKERKQI